VALAEEEEDCESVCESQPQK